MYPHVCASVEGFVQQLATSYISNGYFFYVLGHVPEGKDPARVDAKLIERYGIDISKWTRARRKQAGQASVQYLRFGRLFVLLATHGEHPFFELEGDRVRDVRRVPLKAFGYSIGSRRGRVEVRIEREEFKRLKARVTELGLHRRAETVQSEIRSLPFEPYAPVRRQLLQLVRQVNNARRKRGFGPVPFEAIRTQRRIVRPFGTTIPTAPTGAVNGGDSKTSLVGGRWGEFERGGGASSSPAHQYGHSD